MDKSTETGSSNNKKNIAITIGDPGGIGPEIILKSLLNFNLKKTNFIIIGNYKIFQHCLDSLGLNLNLKAITSLDEVSNGVINVIDIGIKGNFTQKSTSKINAILAFESILTAIKFALKKKIDAIVTAPISKSGFKLAGIDFPGHTEILAHYTKTKDYRMMFIGKKLKVILHTIHIPLKSIFSHITKESLIKTVIIGNKFLKEKAKINNPNIFISGLNPHAGENGLIGDEEIKHIIPAIEELKKNGINVSGPYPPDTIFYEAMDKNADLVVALYHDQGLIAVKTLDFHGSINVTVGIPFIRTSPDHGTAFNIAWENKANPQSMINAIKYAIKFS